MSKTLQEQFNKDHAYFLPYGEDGDFYAISLETPFEEVLPKFAQHWVDLCGEDETLPDCSVGGGLFKHVVTQDGESWMLDHETATGDAKGWVVSTS